MSNTSNTDRRQTWLTRGIVAVILLASANILSQRLVDPDLWGHIQYGEDWLAEGVLPRVASHTYSAPEYPWVNHENLSELALAFGQRTVGGLGMMIGKAVFGILMLLSMIWLAKRKAVHPALAAASMLIVSGALAEFWCARPQLASFLCMAATILVLELAFRDWNEEGSVRFAPLVLLFPIMVIWTNAHGGFVAGFCVVTAYLGLRLIEALWLRGRSAVPQVIELGAAIIGCGLCTLMNPYGSDLLLWLLKSLGQPRPEITEWVSIPNSGPTIIPFTFLTVFTLVCLRWSKLRRDPAHFITIGLVAAQTFMHCRHIAFYAILFGYWMPAHLQSVWDRIRAAGPQRESKPVSSRGFTMLATQFGIVAAFLIGLFAYQMSQFGVDRETYPVDAINFMAKNNLDGRIIVTFNWAQYTLAAKPESTVCFDGRFRTCYPQTVVDMNFDFTIGHYPEKRHRGEDSGPFDPTKVLTFGKPDLVLIGRESDWPASQVISEQSEWTLLYQDHLAQVWGLTNRYANPDSPDYVATREISTEEFTGMVPWPGFPNRSGRDVFIENAKTHLAMYSENSDESHVRQERARQVVRTSLNTR